MFNNIVILRPQNRIKNDYPDVYTEEVNKITLSSDDDEALQTFDRTETYPYGTTSVMVCESERLMVCKAKEKLEI